MAEAKDGLPGKALILCAPVMRLKPGVADAVGAEPPCSDPDAAGLTSPVVRPDSTGADGKVAEDGDDFNT